MAAPTSAQKDIIARLKERGVEETLERLQSRDPATTPLPPRLPKATELTVEAIAARRQLLEAQGKSLNEVYLEAPGFAPESLQGNIENFIGFARIPLGVIGPLRVNGLYAQGDYYVPLATSEGALVASFARGSYIISQSGGARTVVLTESVSRAPAFVFDSLIEACTFASWITLRFDAFKELVEAQSRFCRLQEIKTKLIGKEVYLVFEYTTGDASGQNMVTLATDKICREIIASSPVPPRAWYIDGNLSGDKKATMLSFSYARGKKVIAEVELPRALVERVLHVTPEEMHRYWQVSFMGGNLSGSIGSQGHFANGLAALFLACGQDVACVSEASVGITRIDVTAAGDLYFAVTLPNLIVGTVGGGTSLPTAKECLEMLDCYGAGKAQAFAEICAATVLCGEISMIAALTHGSFAGAHERLGRKHRS